MWHTSQIRRGGTPPRSWGGARPARERHTRTGHIKPTSEAVLEELFWKLRLRRTEDELKTVQQNADLSLSQQQRLQELQELRLSILETLRSR